MNAGREEREGAGSQKSARVVAVACLRDVREFVVGRCGIYGDSSVWGVHKYGPEEFVFSDSPGSVSWAGLRCVLGL